MGNCYGRTVAPRVFHQTLVDFVLSKDGMNMTQSSYDPCFFYKIYPDGTRLDIGIYVDDGWATDNAGALADADIAKLGKRFDIKITDEPRHFLNMNITVESPTRVHLSSEAYIVRMADKYVPHWRTLAKLDVPSTERLTKAYEAAHAREHTPSAEQIKRYGGKVGALIYTSPCVRVDTCYSISRCARALTFPTAELEACADDIIVYLAQTAADGVTFDGHAENAGVLCAESDSDWSVGHSTTGWCCFLSGAAFAYSSKRQACIAMSSTEAEIIAASACAVELVHFSRLLGEMGLPQGVVELKVDNSGAVELSRDRKSCHRSRHVDRRYFKVRELSYEGWLRVVPVPTADNSADLLTKVLSRDVYARHRARLFNSSAPRSTP